MADPKFEDGFTRIPNELLDAFARIRISGEARQALDFIIRKTLGYNKNKDPISLSQFVLGTGLRKSAICKALKKLRSMNIITKKDNNIASEYGILKDYDRWKPLPKKIILPKKQTSMPQKDNSLYPKKRHTKESYIKDNTTKETIGETSSQADINSILDEFYKINPTLEYGNLTQRRAADYLINKFTIEKLIPMLEWYQTVLSDQYCPVATTPLTFKNKLGEVMVYANKLRSPKKGGITKI